MGELKVLSEARYSKLLADIRKLIAEGKARAEEAARNEIVTTYWQIGKRIVEEGLTDNASYGESVIEDISDELGVERTTLVRCISFFKTYNSAPRGTNLSWSHYRELLGVKDDSVRLVLEQKADEEGWSRDQLVKAIRGGSGTSAGSGGSSKGKKISRPTEPTFVYKAVVDRVIDGDTLLLRIDLGFQVWKEQRIRLAEIDCPAMDEPKGREAFEFVRDQMAKASFVMVKTNKIDIYGRYVAHVFYSLDEDAEKEDVFKSGRYLSQELVDKGLAGMF